MTTIKEQAEAYEPTQTKNVADLDKVSTDAKIETRTFKEGTEDEFSIEVISVDGEDYRVPTSVVIQLKAIMEKKPDLKFFSVSKSGEGLKTTYQVINE